VGVLVLRSSGVADGVIISGNAVTLTKAAGGFGSKTTAAPFLWDDVEAYTLGTTAVANGYLALNGAGPQANSVTVSNEWSRGGTRSFKTAIPSQAGPGVVEWFPLVGWDMPDSCTEIYKSYWERYTRTSGTREIRLWKHDRAGANPHYSGIPKYNVTRSTDAALLEDPGEAPDAGYLTETQDIKASPWVGSLHGDQDNFVEYFYKLSTPGGTDGHFYARVNGVTQIAYNNVMTREASESAEFIDYGYIDAGLDYYDSTAFAIYRDQLYCDISGRRVYMTDSATFSSSTKWAMQPPTDWADTSIAATLNTAGFSSGNTAHFHVGTSPTTTVYAGSAALP
jgi:hypothetical protein